VTAIELDRTLYVRLKDRFADTPNVRIQHGDFLAQPLPAEAYSFFSNIPYARTAEIVRKLAFTTRPPDNAYLIMQTAAAKRFLGLPFGPESATSLMIKVRFTPSLIAWLDPREFAPSPSVNSVLLRLAYRTNPLVPPTQLRQFDQFANSVFRSPGRSAMGRLRNLLTVRQARSLINELGFPAAAPPSNIAFEHWLTVFKLIEWNRST
jgi:23S rRNA (adenine-N6)-dimethyltransferase